MAGPEQAWGQLKAGTHSRHNACFETCGSGHTVKSVSLSARHDVGDPEQPGHEASNLQDVGTDYWRVKPCGARSVREVEACQTWLLRGCVTSLTEYVVTVNSMYLS